MRIAICPGSYDPVTKGHVHIIERGFRLFDRVIVVVMVNQTKTASFTMEERVKMMRLSIAHLHNVKVDAYDGLVSEYARYHNACALIKGLRAVSDFEYEFQMAQINKRLNPDLETVFINADSNYTYLSSSMVKEIARSGADLSGFVPTSVEEFIKGRLIQKVG